MKTRQSWVASASVLGTPAAVRPFVVVNPLARRASSAVAEVVGQCYRMGIDAPRSLATSREEPGSQQARQAVEAGADVVVVIGGDGTVRQVARELAGTGIRLGVVALGSGNVLAYNLGLTSLDLRTKVAIALSGPSTELDLGWARLQTVDGRQLDEPFLTMAGIGRDAETVARTDLRAKVRIGAAAYALQGARQATRPALPMHVKVDDQPERAIVTWSVLAGLIRDAPGGLVVYPEARSDDGLMEVLEVPIKHWLQWLPVAAKGILSPDMDVAALRYRRAERLRVRPVNPAPVQLDGDVVTNVTSLQAWIQRRCLRVHLPAREPGAS